MSTPPTLWRDLRRFTPARVALGRVGNGLPTAAHLEFQAAHAAARDAVHAELNVEQLTADLAAAGLSSTTIHSACPDRRTYLLRPDLGRRLAPGEAARLPRTPGIAFVVADGLSATAVQRHAAPLLAQVMPALGQSGPVIIARQGRVALGDEIGAALGADAVAVLIGERPGLSTPDSLGIYLTWQPRPGRTDAERNCISNIRPEGLPIPEAAAKLLWLIAAMRRLGLTGVALKDEQPTPAARISEA
ncbi:MAG: ethanolamine ammonia-lyase subunit EutC [Alphaproteobacteria bacterium]|nr:ethanolamine ammonia-lyase subunit EutC [Alphaproteobacteria bacterium]